MDDVQNSESHMSEVEELKKQLEECRSKMQEYLNGWQRAKADFINYKREENSRLEDIARYASEDVLRDMIGVLDSFDLGLAAMEKQGTVEKGVYMIRAQIEDALKKRGLLRVSIPVGQPYDPALAEAIAQEESELPEGVVTAEIEPGYRLHEKIIRPARVKLSKGKQ